MIWKIAFVAVLSLSVEAVSKCPEECSCPLDEKGRWQVLCLRGGLIDPLPVLKMPSETEILIVNGPKEKPNTLTLGPIFRGLQYLEEIYIINSKIPAIGEHSFWGLRKLNLLNVSHNSINLLLDTNFRGPSALQILDLSHNFIESVPSAVFRHLKILRTLDLSDNRIPELAPRVFFGLSLLESLDLSYNPLGELLHDRFSDLPNLKTFKCIGCGLLTVSDSFMKEIKKTEFLDLSNNRLIVIPPLKDLLSLITLKLNGNLIPKIYSNDLKGPPLREFYISHNRLTFMEDQTFENSSLTVLDISYNRFSYMDQKVLAPVISSLRKLSLSGNSLHIDQLKDILPKGRQLRELGIGDLGLTRIVYDLLRRSRHLKNLNISSNYLSKFPHELLYSTPHLQSLDLSSNNFRGLSQNVIAAFNAMSSLNSVKLERNPWQCQKCHISFLLNWLQTSPKQPHSLSSCEKEPTKLLCLKCVGPENLAGQAMIQLKVENLESCEGPSLLPEWDKSKNSLQNDKPLSSLKNKRDSQKVNTVAAFFKDHIALLVGVACGLVLAIMLVVITALVCSRRQTAYYYTSEEDIEKKEKLMGRNNNDSPVSTPTNSEPVKIPPYEPMAISKVHSKIPIIPGNQTTFSRQIITAGVIPKKRPEIATIQEISNLDS